MFYRKEEINIEYFEEGAVFYSYKNDKFYALDELGSNIWSYIETINEFEFDQIVEHFSKKYKVDEYIISKDMEKFLNDLLEFGAISKISGV